MRSNLCEGWNQITLEEVCVENSGMYGINQPAVDYRSNLYRYLRITDITDDGEIDESKKASVDIIAGKQSKYLLNKNDIVFARTGASAGRSYFYSGTEEPMIFAGFLIKFSIDKSKVIPEYVKYYCQSDKYKNWVKSISTGSTRPNINAQMYRSMKLELPPFDQQRLLVNTLSSIDNKIELNNKINKNLEEQAQAIFKHWFVDFEFPDENGNPYKSSGGEMTETELGVIPEGWEVKSLDEIAQFLNGVAIAKFKPISETDNSLPAVKIRELRQGFIDNSSDMCLRTVDEKYIINDYDMIFSWSGSLLVDMWVGGEAILNQHLFKVTSKEYDQWYYYYWTKHFLEEFIQIARNKATTMGHINRSHLAEAKVLLPDETTYKALGQVLNNMLKLKMKNQKENQKLSQLRDTLLPKLMSGELRIPLD